MMPPIPPGAPALAPHYNVNGVQDGVTTPGTLSPIKFPMSANPELRRFPGKPVILFQNGLSDINGSFSQAGTGGSYTSDTTHTKYSTNSIKLIAGPSGATTYFTVDLTSSQTSNLQQFLQETPDCSIAVLVYIAKPQATPTMSVYLTNQAHRIANSWYSVGTYNLNMNRPGWYLINLMGSRYGNVETNGALQMGHFVDNTSGQNNLLGSSTNFVNSMRFQVSSSANDNIGTYPIYIDSVWVLPHAIPVVMPVFDDCYLSQYTEGLEYFSRKDMVGTIAVPWNLLGTAGYMTVSQLNDFHRAGWDIVNHSTTHINANIKSVNSICLTQSLGSAGNLTLNGATGGAVFDAPRCVTITPAGNEAGRPFTVTGLDQNGQAQTDVIYGQNAVITVSETIWTQVTQISSPSATTGNVQVGTTYSYSEIYTEYNTCKTNMVAQGWIEALDQVIYPNGATNVLVDQVTSALGFKAGRTLNVPMVYYMPFVNGLSRMMIPAYGGGGATAMNNTAYAVVSRYNTGNGTIATPTFTASVTPILRWYVTMTAATTFNVTDDENRFIGSGSTGAAFSYTGANPSTLDPYTVTFTVTAGGTAFVAGDQFFVTVTSLVMTAADEAIRRGACVCCYFHNFIRSGTQGSLDTMVSDMRNWVDRLKRLEGQGKVRVLKMTQFSAMQDRIG